MAGSLLKAGKALIVRTSAEAGGKVSISVSTDNVEVAIQLCKTATTLGALYVGYQHIRPIVKAAVKKALGGDRDDQGDPDIKPGSLHVQLHCFSDKRYLQVLADYESGRMKERSEEEFSHVGIKVDGLKVEIENMAEVNKTKEAINKRYMAKVKTTKEAINKRYMAKVKTTKEAINKRYDKSLINKKLLVLSMHSAFNIMVLSEGFVSGFFH